MIRRVFAFIKEDILRIKPIFKIKIEKSWWSKDYVNIKFSNNNGWTWQYIIGRYDDVFSEYKEEYIKVQSFHIDSVESMFHELRTYDACIAYNNKIRKKVKEYNEWRKKEYDKKLADRRKIFDRYGK